VASDHGGSCLFVEVLLDPSHGILGKNIQLNHSWKLICKSVCATRGISSRSVLKGGRGGVLLIQFGAQVFMCVVDELEKLHSLRMG
jgi:hypothetical protein